MCTAVCKAVELRRSIHQLIQMVKIFSSTLVDRIATGYPRNEVEANCKENNYLDNIIDTGEVLALGHRRS